MELFTTIRPSYGYICVGTDSSDQRHSQNIRRRKSRKRGKRGGVRERSRRQALNRIPLPSMMLMNAQSLRNKVDELQAHVRFQHEFRDACLLAITESWLTNCDLDADLALDGFGEPFRLDRDAGVTGKSQGGGVCLFVNERWCKNVLVRECVCTKDAELLSVSLRPPYLPREFPQIFVNVVYVHPKANVDKASETIHHATLKLQSVQMHPFLYLVTLTSVL